MLETIVLDNTERLLAGAGERSQLSNISNMIVSQSQMTCIARDSKAAFPFSVLANWSVSGNTSIAWRSDSNNVLLLADYASSFDVLAVDMTTHAMTQDSTGRQFDYITEDASGVIWANAINAGQYGLWKRTGAGAWTKVLADTGAGYVRRWSDNKIYYRSNAGNWYECTAGTAVVSADPSGGTVNWYLYSGYGGYTNDTAFNRSCNYSPAYLTGMGTLPATVGYCESAAEQVSARYWPINAVGQTAGTLVNPISNINWEMLAECSQPNIPNVSTDIQALATAVHRFTRLDNTYMLHSVAVQINQLATTRLPVLGGRKIVLSLLNKTTGVNKYLGSLYLTGSSTQSVSATNAAIIYGNLLSAKLTSGVLDLYIAQGTYVTAVASDRYGLFKKSLTLNLDF